MYVHAYVEGEGLEMVVRNVVFEYSQWRAKKRNCSTYCKNNYSVFLYDLLKKKSMNNVKVRLKYFFLYIIKIILLLRENNRPARVKYCLLEMGLLFTHGDILLGAKGRTE